MRLGRSAGRRRSRAIARLAGLRPRGRRYSAARCATTSDPVPDHESHASDAEARDRTPECGDHARRLADCLRDAERGFVGPWRALVSAVARRHHAPGVGAGSCVHAHLLASRRQTRLSRRGAPATTSRRSRAALQFWQEEPVVGAISTPAWWGQDGLIYEDFGTLYRKTLSGPPEVFAKPDEAKRETYYYGASVTPDGRAVVFSIVREDTESFDRAVVAVKDLQTGDQKVLLSGGMSPRVTTTGHLLFGRAGALHAVEVDTESLGGSRESDCCRRRHRHGADRRSDAVRRLRQRYAGLSTRPGTAISATSGRFRPSRRRDAGPRARPLQLRARVPDGRLPGALGVRRQRADMALRLAAPDPWAAHRDVVQRRSGVEP